MRLDSHFVEILVLDFGSQYTQLIARRLREYGVYTEIVPYFETLDSIKAKNPKGIILSGGPASVYEKDAYKPDGGIFTLGIPILGICYGMQYIADFFGGRVIRADAQEFGKAVLEIINQTQPLEFQLLNAKDSATLERLIDLWEDSARASHLFLSKKDITQIRHEVKKAFQRSQKIIIAKSQDEFMGFIGVKKNSIEMLFVAPNAFKKGVGKALISEAFKRFLKDYQNIKVDCNEQNPQGLGFYQHLGFEIIGKSPKDSAGRDFPIVHLEAKSKNLAKALQEKCLNYRIEVAQKQDLKAILTLQHTAFIDEAKRVGKMDIEPMTQDLQSIEQDFKEQRILKCSLENGEIVGSVRGMTQGDTTYIRKLFVNPKYRKKGIASALIHTLCAKLPTKRYELFTSEKSTENIALYEKLGFVRFKCEKPKGFPIKAVFLEKFADSKDTSSPFKDTATNILFQGVKQDSIVWMSHADKVEKIPKGFVELAKSGNTHYCAIADFKRKIYALQFHPEVVHSECGGQMLHNFAVGICGSDTSWNMHNFAENEIAKLRAIVGVESPKTFITFKEACKEIGQKQTIKKLLQIWEDGARATHQDLSEKEINGMKKEIEESILESKNLLIAYKKNEWIGFVATEANEITMLFVAPQYFGCGYGKALIKAAYHHYLSRFDEVMLGSLESALGFYQHLGFERTNAKPIQAGMASAFSPKLIPLSAKREKLQQSLGTQPPKIKRCEWATDRDEYARKLYEDYHDNEWGVPLHDDNKLFELLVLEVMQAGLSWITILKKREAFRIAFDDFDPKIVANYNEAKIEELMQNEGIIRNRLKVESAIINAKLFLEIQREFGSFDKYIWGFVGEKPIVNSFNGIADLPASTPLSDKISKDLKKRGFKFVGSTIIYAFMQSAGIVNDHLTTCFKHNSSLGMQCDKIRDFSQGTDAKSANLAKNQENLHNHTSNTRIVKNAALDSREMKQITNLEIKNSKIVDSIDDCASVESVGNAVLDSNAVESISSLEVSLDNFCGCQARNKGVTSRVMTEVEGADSAKIGKETTSKVLCAVSGGVDSSVVATLLYRAIGENLIPVFVDTGLLRKGEREAVEKMFRENLKVPLITADASDLFLSRLKGVIDPEIKRKIIGETFIEVFEKEAKKHNQKGEIKFLAQGTLYPDVIESVSVKGPSKTIKSHHNVGGLPEWMQFELIEPLRELFKDEVRALGRELGMPETMLMRHPFPGPGLAIRIMGEVNKKDLDLLREADSIFIDELHKQGYYDKVWQAFCVLLNVRSVGVMGDNRTYDNTICVRAVEAIDGMTATFAHLPHDFLESVSNRIINEVEGINRVVFDITSKPPGTIEWE